MYNNCKTNQIRNYIDVYNFSSNILMRYLGIYHSPGMATPYTSPEFITGEHFIFAFPDNAVNASLTIQVYNYSRGFWQDVFTTAFSFPDGYCYRVSGTFDNPQVTQIPCLQSNSFTNNVCCNNVIKQRF